MHKLFYCFRGSGEVAGSPWGHRRVTCALGREPQAHTSFPWQLQRGAHVHSLGLWPRGSSRMWQVILWQKSAAEGRRENTNECLCCSDLYAIRGLQLHVHTLYHVTLQFLPP